MLGNFFKRIAKGFVRVFTRSGRQERKEMKQQYDEQEIYNNLKVKEFYVTARGKNPSMKISYVMENGKIVEKRELNVQLPKDNTPGTPKTRSEGEKPTSLNEKKVKSGKIGRELPINRPSENTTSPEIEEKTKSSISLDMFEEQIKKMTPEQKEKFLKMREEAFKKLMGKAHKKKVLKRGNSVKEDGESPSM